LTRLAVRLTEKIAGEKPAPEMTVTMDTRRPFSSRPTIIQRTKKQRFRPDMRLFDEGRNG